MKVYFSKAEEPFDDAKDPNWNGNYYYRFRTDYGNITIEDSVGRSVPIGIDELDALSDAIIKLKAKLVKKLFLGELI